MRALFAVAALALAACSSPDGRPLDPSPAPAPTSSASAPVTLRIMPGTTHSGFDGVHDFRVPVAIYGSPDATLAADPDAASIAPAQLVDPSQDDGKYFLVTTKRAGTVTLTASAHGASASASLEIAAYTASEYATGEQRYTTGSTSGPACASCHAGASGIDHSPSQMASASDGDVVSVITTGVLVEGNPITQVRHKWAVTDAEAKGLVAYLRALAPRGFAGGS